MLGSVTNTFVNPFYVAPVAGTSVIFNYAEPIPVYADYPPETVIAQEAPVASPDASPVVPNVTEENTGNPVEEPVDPKAKQAGVFFDKAIQSFKSEDYVAAVAAIDKAIESLPNDAALHEFRSLALFAQRKYTEAAGVIYSVLAVGPGWTWETVKSFYADWHTYEKQLKDLKTFVDANPKDGAAHFLLAYHYLVLDEREQAVKMLNRVVELIPDDSLAQAMATSISQSLQKSSEDRPMVGN